jgi:hypothetical protein
MLLQHARRDHGEPDRFRAHEVLQMERKVFWIMFILLGLIADIVLPLMWGIIATVPIFILSWWVAYRSEWFG